MTMQTRIFGVPVEFTYLEDGTVEGRFSEQGWVDQFGDGYAETFIINDESETYLLPFELRSTYAQPNGQLFTLVAAMGEDANAFITGRDDPNANWLMVRMFRRATLHNKGWDGHDALLGDE